MLSAFFAVYLHPFIENRRVHNLGSYFADSMKPFGTLVVVEYFQIFIQAIGSDCSIKR